MKGRIYKIVSDHTDKIYIGSTTHTLEKRLIGHKSEYKGYMNGKSWSHVASYDLIALGEVRIELVEEVEFNERHQLLRRESYWIEQHRLTALNKANPINENKERTQCECGITYPRDRRHRHIQSAKHITFMDMKRFDA